MQIASDALVFFGATGDLAHKKIFPALQKLAERGRLEIPVIGVAKSGWNLQQLQERAKNSVENYGGLDAEGFPKLISKLKYIDGDYSDPATFSKLRQELGASQHPLHYLAIPPVLFSEVLKQLKASGCAVGGRGEGSCNHFFGACSAFTHVTACTLAESPSDPLHRELRQLCCLRCRLDCYYGPLRHPIRPGLSLTRCRLIASAITAGASRVATGQICLLMRPGNAGGGKGPQLKGNARSNEGGGIGVEPNNPSKRSEIADGVARQSEGIAQLPLLRFVRQGVPQGCSGIRLRVLQSQWRSGRSGQSDVRGHRDVRRRALAGRTGARAEEPNLSTTSCAACLYTC